MHSRCNKHMKCQGTWCYAQVLVLVTPGVLHYTLEIEEIREKEWKSSPEETTSPEPRVNSLIAGDSKVRSTHRMHRDEAMGETNVGVPSDSTDYARIESNCSPELSPELKPLRTSTSNYGRWGMNMRKPFHNSECAQRGEAGHIHIAGVWTRWKFRSNSDFIIY